MSKSVIYYVKNSGQGFNEVRGSDHNMGVIDVVHRKIHAGRHFSANDNAKINASAIRTNACVIGNTDIECHMNLSITANLSGIWKIFFESKLTDNGTALTVFNHKLASTTTSMTRIYHTPTISTSGILFRSVYIGTGSGGHLLGGSDSCHTELILKKNTKYISQFIADANDTIINHFSEWYDENEDGD